MQLRKKLPVVATLLSLGGLTGVAMNAGGSRKRDDGAVPVADIRTVTMQQTIHRYKHVGIGGPANDSWPVGGGVATVGHRIAVAVHTRASGAKATPKALSSGGHSNVKSGPSGTHRTVGKHQPAGSGHSATPSTRSSGSGGSKSHGSGGGASNPPARGNPTTKPSGNSSETTGTSTPTTPAPPTTKPSGAPPSGESGGGTPTTPTPPPTTKPSGAPEGGGSGGEGGGETKGGGGHGED
jgi:hypothetical protein